ncbi:class I SAM-dependent DNA methyltransferase [Celerinatantimonas yamalensis]|uniref:Class I SAM-dependent methyltransferase n=1 Tax=Celerinatantimonas yamalensis TaxID=559956 RepID=A0ABW9G7J1_9GAMM
MSSYFDRMANDWDKNRLKVERAKITAHKIKEIDFNSYNSCIDFGSGTGLLGVQLKDTFTKIHLADSSTEMLNVARRKLAESKIANVETHHVNRLSDLTSKHSAIVTLMALHHIDNVKDFFVEAYGLLEQKGTLIIADLYEEDGSFHKHDLSFKGHNGFDVQVLSNVAESAGFKVEKLEQYYEIWKENFDGKKVSYPLFMFVAKRFE